MAVTEYQTVIVRLHGRTREDEDAVTDLLNERARMGWSIHSIVALDTTKLVTVFSRDT